MKLELRLEADGERACYLQVHVAALPSVWFFSRQHEREITEVHSEWFDRVVRRLELHSKE